MRRILKIISVGFLVIMSFGCVKEPITTPMVKMKVDSLGNQNEKNKYVLLSGIKDVDNNNLQFQEFSKYIDTILQQKGFVKTDFENADIAIFLLYGISEPQQNIQQYAIPILGQTGISSSQTYGIANTYGTLNTYGNNGYYQGNTYSNQTTYNTPTYGVTGYQNGMLKYTTYTRYFKINALDMAAYKNFNKQVQIWETTVTSSGSSGDLRFVFPILVAGAKDYIGTNTGKQIEIELLQDDQKVLDIKNSSKKN